MNCAVAARVQADKMLIKTLFAGMAVPEDPSKSFEFIAKMHV